MTKPLLYNHDTKVTRNDNKMYYLLYQIIKKNVESLNLTKFNIILTKKLFTENFRFHYFIIFWLPLSFL